MKYLLFVLIGALAVMGIGTCRRRPEISEARRAEIKSKALKISSAEDIRRLFSKENLEIVLKDYLTGNPDRDSIIMLSYQLGVKFYEYSMHTEIIPHSLYLKVEHSGYHQFTVTNDGPRYRNYWIKFYTTEKLLTEEAIVKYADRHPELCMPFYPTSEELADFDKQYEKFIRKSELVKKGMTEEEAEGALHFWELHEDMFKD